MEAALDTMALNYGVVDIRRGLPVCDGDAAPTPGILSASSTIFRPCLKTSIENSEGDAE